MPIEELIPKGYTVPFYTSKGEHPVHDHVSVYAYCNSVKNASDVSCFVIDSRNRVRRIHLGVLADSSSLVARFLDKIDAEFGRRRFTKEDIKSFGHKMVGNNQPTKAVVEYLCHKNFLVKSEYSKGPAKFERTGKARPVSTLDAAAPDKEASRLAQTIQYPFYH